MDGLCQIEKPGTVQLAPGDSSTRAGPCWPGRPFTRLEGGWCGDKGYDSAGETTCRMLVTSKRDLASPAFQKVQTTNEFSDRQTGTEPVGRNQNRVCPRDRPITGYESRAGGRLLALRRQGKVRLHSLRSTGPGQMQGVSRHRPTHLFSDRKMTEQKLPFAPGPQNDRRRWLGIAPRIDKFRFEIPKTKNRRKKCTN